MSAYAPTLANSPSYWPSYRSSSTSPFSEPSETSSICVASGTFLASELFSGKRAGQGLFSGWLGVLPKSTPWGVGVESEDVVEAFLGGVGVGEDALGAGTAFVPGGVEQDGFLDAGEVGQELPDAEVQPA